MRFSNRRIVWENPSLIPRWNNFLLNLTCLQAKLPITRVFFPQKRRVSSNLLHSQLSSFNLHKTYFFHSIWILYNLPPHLILFWLVNEPKAEEQNSFLRCKCLKEMIKSLLRSICRILNQQSVIELTELSTKITN